MVPCFRFSVPQSAATCGPRDPPEPQSQATHREPDFPTTNSHLVDMRASAEDSKSTPSLIPTGTLLRRVVALEERDVLVSELAAKVEAVQRDLMLSKASVSGLSALQDVMSVDKWALGAALQGCPRAMLMVRVKACPPRRNARTRRCQTALTIDHIAVRGAVDQLADMCHLEVERTRSMGGRVEGRVIRFSGCCAALSMLSCSESETTASLCHSFGRRDGTITTKLLLERFTQQDGKEWYVFQRHDADGTAEVARRDELSDSVLRRSTGGALVRETVRMKDVPGLGTSCPVVLRWSPVGHHGRPAGSTDNDVVGRVSLVFPVCIVEDAGADLQALL